MILANNRLSCSGKGLKSKNWLFGKSDPYLEIHRINPDGTFTLAHRTSHLLKTLNPNWQPIQVSQRTLVGNGDLNTQLVMRVMDWNARSDPRFIGECWVSLEQLLSKPGISFELTIPNKPNKKKQGNLVINSCQRQKMYSFLDYITGGTNMNLIVAIDLTASNGNPRNPDSLHYFSANGQLNQYEKAMYAIGSILECYDTDKQFPVYGFGAQLPTGQVSHCFAMNGNNGNPEVNGVNGILGVYRHGLTQVTLYGPTNFSPCIRQTIDIAKTSYQRSPQGSNYFVLFILTDGEITDMERTIDAIVDASEHPISIVIVGVGNANFSKMDMLDGDGHYLQSSTGKRAKQDNVQFVAFNKFSSANGYDADLLAREVSCSFSFISDLQ